jgi:hypothetical protein
MLAAIASSLGPDISHEVIYASPVYMGNVALEPAG